MLVSLRIIEVVTYSPLFIFCFCFYISGFSPPPFYITDRFSNFDLLRIFKEIKPKQPSYNGCNLKGALECYLGKMFLFLKWNLYALNQKFCLIQDRHCLVRNSHKSFLSLIYDPNGGDLFATVLFFCIFVMFWALAHHFLMFYENRQPLLLSVIEG